jgi:hypothetical protein
MRQKSVSLSRQTVKRENLFSIDLENMLASDIPDSGGGYMNGSLSGESWKSFLKDLRQEAVNRLKAYRSEGTIRTGFRASSLQPYCEERMRIEREYVRGLVNLYGNAERTYKNLSG